MGNETEFNFQPPPLNSNATYRPSLASTLARCSALAYTGRIGLQLRMATKVPEMTGATHFEHRETDTQYFIGTLASGSKVIAFRGSSSLRDFLTDFDVSKVNVSGEVAVHRGFHHAFQPVFTTIVERLRDLRQRAPDAEIYLTGHSLGGALAQLCALWLRLNGMIGGSQATSSNQFDIAGIYTFGGPRVGNAAWARLYNAWLGDRTFRVVNREDPVPRMPLLGLSWTGKPWRSRPVWSGLYQHAGHEVFLDQFGQLLLDPSLDCKLVSDIRGIWKAYAVKRQAALAPDHFIENYVKLTEFRQAVQQQGRTA